MVNEELKEELEQQLEHELEKMREHDYDESADAVEEFSAVELRDEDLISDIKTDFPEASNLINSMHAGLRAVEEEFLKEQTDGSESTEEAETDLEVEDFLDETTQRKVRLSGYLDDDTYFHVLFPQKNGEVRPVVVTSDGEMKPVRNKKEELKKQEGRVSNLNKYDYQYFNYDPEEYRFKHEITSFPELGIFQPDNHTLKYLNGEEVSEEIYNDVKSKVKKYWDHFDDEWFDVVTAWIIHTYLINGIGFTVYLMPKGRENTGKTTLQKLVTRLSYNGFFSGKNTSAASSRIAHHLQATLNLDEFEKAVDNEVQGVFNTGQRKGATYVLTNMNKRKVKDQITALWSFCPKTVSVNSTHQFDKHFLSRNIILEATRTERSLENIETMSQSEREEFQELRNHLLAYSLFKHDDLLGSIKQYQEEIEKSGREADKLAVISGIIKHFKGKERADEVAEFIESSEELQEDQLNQKIEVLLEEVIDRFNEEEEEVRVNPKNLATHVNQTLDIEDEYEISARGVGNRLRDYNILRKDWQSKRSGPNGETMYTIPREFLKDSLKRYGLDQLKEILDGANGSDSVPSVSTADSVDRTLEKLGGKNESVETHELIVASEYDEETVQRVVERRLDEGKYFEPKPGHIRLLQ
jgi:hypothetical protein